MSEHEYRATNLQRQWRATPAPAPDAEHPAITKLLAVSWDWVGGDPNAPSNGTVELTGKEEAEAAVRALIAENKALRRVWKGEIWYWQPEGGNEVESLTCPVLIDVDDLRALIAERDELLHRLVEAREWWLATRGWITDDRRFCRACCRAAGSDPQFGGDHADRCEVAAMDRLLDARKEDAGG